MIQINRYIRQFNVHFPGLKQDAPWSVTTNIGKILLDKIKTLNSDFKIFNEMAIHKSVIIDSHAIVKGPAIISAGCFIGAHSYLRGGIFMDENVSVGPGCEVKTSFLFSRSALGHFNFVGDSLIGSGVNLEAGAVIANHYNERAEKNIIVVADGKSHATGVEKFGALVGDHSKIGANAVLSPGTILLPGTIVSRLQLIDQQAGQ